MGLMAKSSQQRAYKVALLVTLLLSTTSGGMTIANYVAARRNMRAGRAVVEQSIPNYAERQYRPEAGAPPRKDLSVLGIEFLRHGFLSTRAATLMLVGTFLWPLIFLGYAADFRARKEEELPPL